MTLIGKEIGELLVDNGLLTPEDLGVVEQEKLKTGESISKILARLGFASENQLKDTLELNYGVTFVSLAKLNPDRDLVKQVPEDVIRQLQVVPISLTSSRLTLAMVNPDNSNALNEIRNYIHSDTVKSLVCIHDDFDSCVDQIFGVRTQLSQSTNGAESTVLPEPDLSFIDDTAPLSVRASGISTGENDLDDANATIDASGVSSLNYANAVEEAVYDRPPPDLGELLLSKGIIDDDQLYDALKIGLKTKQSLAEVLISMELVTEEDLQFLLAEYFGSPLVESFETDESAQESQIDAAYLPPLLKQDAPLIDDVDGLVSEELPENLEDLLSEEQLGITDELISGEELALPGEMLPPEELALLNRVMSQDQPLITNETTLEEQSEIADEVSSDELSGLFTDILSEEETKILDQAVAEQQPNILAELVAEEESELLDQLVVEDKPEILDELIPELEPELFDQEVYEDEPGILDQLVTQDEPGSLDQLVTEQEPEILDQLVTEEESEILDQEVSEDEPEIIDQGFAEEAPEIIDQVIAEEAPETRDQVVAGEKLEILDGRVPEIEPEVLDEQVTEEEPNILDLVVNEEQPETLGQVIAEEEPEIIDEEVTGKESGILDQAIAGEEPEILDQVVSEEKREILDEVIAVEETESVDQAVFEKKPEILAEVVSEDPPDIIDGTDPEEKLGPLEEVPAGQESGSIDVSGSSVAVPDESAQEKHAEVEKLDQLKEPEHSDIAPKIEKGLVSDTVAEDDKVSVTLKEMVTADKKEPSTLVEQQPVPAAVADIKPQEETLKPPPVAAALSSQKSKQIAAARGTDSESGDFKIVEDGDAKTAKTGLPIQSTATSSKLVKEETGQFDLNKSLQPAKASNESKAGVATVTDFDELEDDIDFLDLVKQAQYASISLLANHVTSTAIEQKCSDILVQGISDDVVVQYLKKGRVVSESRLVKQILPDLVACYKEMAGLDKLLTNKPQDRKVKLNVRETDIELRVTTVPEDDGEIVAISIKYL